MAHGHSKHSAGKTLDSNITPVIRLVGTGLVTRLNLAGPASELSNHLPRCSLIGLAGGVDLASCPSDLAGHVPGGHFPHRPLRVIHCEETSH